MANVFSGSEIVELGVQIEKNGRDFYDTLTKKSKHKEARRIFEYLSGEEEKHIATFEKILSSVHKYEPVESYPGEYFAYMNALASDYVFTQKGKGKEIARGIGSDIKAINMGIQFEKDSIVFYGGIKRVVPEFDHKIVDELIKQEQDHLRQLIELKNNI